MVAGQHWHICTLSSEASNDHCRCNSHRMVQIGVFTFLIWRVRFWCTWKSWINLPENIPERPLIWSEKCTDFSGTTFPKLSSYLAAFWVHLLTTVPNDLFLLIVSSVCKTKLLHQAAAKSQLINLRPDCQAILHQTHFAYHFLLPCQTALPRVFCHQSQWQLSTRNSLPSR